MKAMILCAGLGTRLRPFTYRWPKPAMPFFGQPLFRYSLSTLRKAGIEQVGINTHHLPHVMEATARAECERSHCSLTVAHENGEIQGTGGGIRGLKNFLQDDHFVVLNGDVLFSVDLKPLIASHLASGAVATMVLMPMPEGEKFNPVEVNAEGQVRKIAGIGPGGDRLSPWHFTGVHIMTPAVFDFMSATGAEDINRDVYVRMMNKGLTIRAERLTSPQTFWSDMGTPQRYAEAHQHLLFGQASTALFGDADPFSSMQRSAFGWHGDALPSNVKAAGPVWVAPGVKLGAGVRLGSAVSIAPGCDIGANAHLNRVAVLNDTQVPGDALYEDCMIATVNGKLEVISTTSAET